MAWIWHVRLFPLFELYLAVMFLVGLAVRVRQYREVVHLVFAFPNRWPRVVQLVRQHVHILCTWGTILPLVLSALLLAVQLFIRWFLLPGAVLTVASLLELWPMLPVVLLALAGMIGYDVYLLLTVGEIDRPALEKQLDKAEYWLRSWTAPMVRVLSLGFVNPRAIVQQEVAGALVAASELMNRSLYTVALQAGFRTLYGLALWTTYLLQPWLRTWLSGG